MHDFFQIILGIIFLAAIFILTRIGVVRQMRQAATLVIQDLERLGAFDLYSAADLPYAGPHYFRIGLRDYRPKALESLIQAGTVGKTESGRYYLIRRVNMRDDIY